MLEKYNRDQLLQLARAVLENELHDAQHDLSLFENSVLEEKRGLFVTLQANGALRGCVGRVEAQNSVYTNVLALAKSAAFEDPRFDPLKSVELDSIKIEISLLTAPEEVIGETNLAKVARLRPHIDGVILSVGNCQATFLPQVWDNLPDHRDFMSHLCKKAKLDEDYWLNYNIHLKTYQVEHFQEE